jgi:hypothetical protein
MEPGLEKLLEEIKSDSSESIVTKAEAKFLIELEKIKSRNFPLYIKYYNKYCDIKLLQK